MGRTIARRFRESRLRASRKSIDIHKNISRIK
jgi:hypothetical protein